MEEKTKEMGDGGDRGGHMGETGEKETTEENGGENTKKEETEEKMEDRTAVRDEGRGKTTEDTGSHDRGGGTEGLE
jgi:hypothetical protein